ncbi:MAG TPA: GGDEF domain-containing protein, partial [Candidatus Binataceae bacterium]|nr:GGDEF domain-containing protein [Candidatus Binataceae bacterium]
GLTTAASPELVAETEQRFEHELEAWGQRATKFYKEKTDEVKEVLQLVAKAAAQVAERDARYGQQLGTLSDRLHSTMQLDDLTAIRQSLAQNVDDLKTYVTKMTHESQESVAQLRAKVVFYETRLEEVERIAFQDGLTGLANRRSLERQLDFRITQGLAFNVIYLDLNGFKPINDRLGHAAGDDLLKQFAAELKSAFRANDAVGRLGGDEFLVIADGDFQVAEERVERIERWVNGAYTLTVNGNQHKVTVGAAIGAAAWRPGETVDELLQRADAAMYQHKLRKKSARATQ